ncbi:hypothetical protein BX666DRAFT_2028914 [Dichotomocladium elegans]|nr:hypothetical protein BX666DRAFT_2028914 [Dichotomocladium elegans]
MSSTGHHLLQAIESLNRHSQTKRQANTFDSYMFAPTDPLFPSAFGDEHLPYSPYYSSGVSSNSCASSLLSSSSSVASAEDLAERKSTALHGQTNRDRHIQTVAVTGTATPSGKSCHSALGPKHVNHDHYGFQWPTQWVDIEKIDAFERMYQATLANQARKWHLLLQETHGELPPLCPRLKRHVRRGIPRHLRRRVWMKYSGASRMMEQNPGLFKMLVGKASSLLSDRTVRTIDHELRHLFPDNIYFARTSIREDEESNASAEVHAATSRNLCAHLRQILLAFHAHAPVETLLLEGTTTTRALATLAGFILAVLGEPDEEEVFWLLERLIFSYYDEHHCAHYDPIVLMQLVSEKMPSVWNKISNKQCFWDWVGQETMSPVALVTSHWFLGAFIHILPAETVARVWDCFIMEGYPILFRVALTLIKLGEPEIDGARDNIQVTRILQNSPHRFIDCDDLLQKRVAE